MRTAPKAEDWCDSGQVDWKAGPQTVLEAIDEQLVEHGLEIVMAPADSDEYEWVIRKRVVAPIKADYAA